MPTSNRSLVHVACLGLVAATFLSNNIASAQGQTPPTTAATAPLVDLSSPKSAVRSLHAAVQRGDAESVRRALYARNEHERQLADAFADLFVAGKTLGDAAKERFGPGGAVLGRGTLGPEEAQRIESAEVTVVAGGNEASVALPDQPRPMRLRRDGGEWKLLVGDYAGASGENPATQLQLVQNMTAAFNEVAEEIAAGRFATAPDAEASIRQKLNDVMIRSVRPTTAPATQPAAR